MIGQSIGPYAVLSKLGEGGMGEVYRARDARLGRDIALKVLHADVARDAVRLERFTREARAVAALNHPHIVTIYSTEEVDGIRFMTMELIEGRPLDALIPQEGLPVARFLEVAMPIADALTAAHQKQITHRDLKPGNVMVTPDGRVKVLDFGLARVEDSPVPEGAIDATRAVLTGEGTIVGTMPYMSPEQVEGRPLDARSDLFSLGVMFYEMLAGSRPFHGSSSPALMSAILRDVPAPVTDRRSDVPEALARLVARCLEKHPAERVQTARDVFNELRHVQKQIESGSRRRSGSEAAAPEVEASLWIAVLPFGARSLDADTEALAAGLTEDVTSGLSRFPALSVIAPQSAAAYRNSPLDVQQIAERLGARYVLGGTVRKSASAVRIAAHLVDARSGAHLWTETYDQPLEGTDLFAIQDDVTDRVVATVADKDGVLARSMGQVVRSLPLERLSMRELVQRCWILERRPDPSDHAALRAAVEERLTRDAASAHLWAELANLYVGEHALGLNPAPGSLPRAMQAARRAVELDPGHQNGWAMIAYASFFAHDEVTMRDAATRAIRLNSRNTHTLALVGNILTCAGQYDDGWELTSRAMALNPAHPGWYHFAPFNRLFARGEFTEALNAARRVNVPDLIWMHFAIAAAAGHLGLAPEGRAAVEALIGLAREFEHDANVRDFVTRWYWPPDLIERLLEGLALARGTTDAIPPARSYGLTSGNETLPATGHDAARGARSAERPRSGPASAPASAALAAGMRVAVLPFTARGGDDASALAEGLTDEITAALARFPYLKVISRAAVAAVEPEQNDAAAARSGARFVLEGSARKAGSVIRVTARLSDVQTGTHLWAETFDREVTSGVFAVQDDVAGSITSQVADPSGALVRSMAAASGDVPLDQLTTAELTLQFFAHLERFEAAQHAALRDAFEAALAREPHDATAWGCLSDLYMQEFAPGLNPRAEPLDRQRAAAERAIELDATCQYGWLGLAMHRFYSGDHTGFAQAGERAIALNPLNSHVVGLIGNVLAIAVDRDRGLALVRRALTLNPHIGGHVHLAPFLDSYGRGDDEAALASAKRFNIPTLSVGHLNQAAAAGQLGRADDARAALDALRRVDPALCERDAAAEAFGRILREPALVQRLIDGFEKALALVNRTAGQPGSPPPLLTAGDTRTIADGRAALERPAVADTGSDRGTTVAVAVRPFTARADDADASELARGLTDDVTTGLSRFRYVRVRSLAAAGDDRDPRSGGAAYVLDGAVRRGGAAFRVNARLTAVTTGEHLWAEQYDHEAPAGLFALQDDLASRVVATLADGGGVLGRALAEGLRNADPRSPEGLLAGWARYVEHFTPEKHAALRDGLEALVGRQPGTATAWAYLSILYGHEIFFDFNPRPDPVLRLRQAAERAVTLDPDNQSAWYALSQAEFCERHLAAFRSAAERTIQLNPLQSRTLGGIGLSYCYAGDVERGAALVARAMSLNPRLPGWLHIVPFIEAYRRGDADAAFTHAARINMPHLPVGGRLFGIAAAGRFGREREARDGLRLVHDSRPELLSAEAARRQWSRWFWEGELLDGLVEGYAAALALAAETARGAPTSPTAAAASARDPRIRAPQTATYPPVAELENARAVTHTHRSDAVEIGTPSGAAVRAGRESRSASIAVLPFVDLSATRDQEWFCDGVAEEILNALTQLPGLHVAARTSAFTFRGREAHLRAIADALDVGTVLQGSVRRLDDRVRITVQLVNTSDGYQLWSESYDRELTDIFDVQEQIARAVAERLKVTFAIDSRDRRTSNPAAYEAYLRGRSLLYRRGSSILPAMDRFREALTLDPAFALAWAGLADAYAVSAYFGLVRGDQARREGTTAARRALALSPELPEALTAMAGLELICDNDVASAERHFAQALAVNPSYIQARCWYALFYLQWTKGRFDEGVAEARRTQALDPLSAYVWTILAVTLSQAGQASEGVEAAERAVCLDPESFVAQWALSVVLREAGRLEEAETGMAKAAAMSARHPLSVSGLAVIHARRGRRDLSAACHEELLGRAASAYVPLTQLVLTADMAGRRDEAIDLARRAMADREPPFILFARYFHDFASIREDPRFGALVAELDTPGTPSTME